MLPAHIIVFHVYLDHHRVIRDADPIQQLDERQTGIEGRQVSDLKKVVGDQDISSGALRQDGGRAKRSLCGF